MKSHIDFLYQVGTVTEEHVKLDIDDAIACGITGFSLNIGDPRQPFVATTLQYMFAYAHTVDFSIHISMDIWASGDATGGHPELYNSILSAYVADPSSVLPSITSHTNIALTFSLSYYHFSPGRPFITTFSDGGLNHTQWADWKSTALNNQLYFCPDFDGTAGYTSGADGWWYVHLFIPISVVH